MSATTKTRADSFTCKACGAAVTQRTQVAWPKMKVRYHTRCLDCWVQWTLFTRFIDLWFGAVLPLNPHKGADTVNRRYEYRRISSRVLQVVLDEIGNRGGELHTLAPGGGFVDMGHHLMWWHIVIDWEPSIESRERADSGVGGVS